MTRQITHGHPADKCQKMQTSAWLAAKTLLSTWVGVEGGSRECSVEEITTLSLPQGSDGPRGKGWLGCFKTHERMNWVYQWGAQKFPTPPCPLLDSHCVAHAFIKDSRFMVCCCCSLVAQSCPASSVHGISQARLLEWVAISFTKGSSRPRDRTQVFCIGRWVLYPLSHQGSASWSVKIHYNIPQASLRHISHIWDTWETQTSVFVSYFCY